MKEGVKVRVIANYTGHEFVIGEIVERRFSKYDGSSDLGFVDERGSVWYMNSGEYEIVDKSYVVYLLEQVLEASVSQGFSQAFNRALRDMVDLAAQEANTQRFL